MEDFRGGSPIAKVFYFLTGFGHASVVVFFVLSGFLVGRKVRQMAAQDRPDLHLYMIDRFSRIFVVGWPAMLFSLAVLALVVSAAPTAPYVTSPGWSLALSTPLLTDFSLSRWLGAFTLVNELVTRTPGINGPLWSLACEWTYYVIAAAIVALYRHRWSWLIPYAVLLAGFAIMRDPEMVTGGGVWCLGVIGSAAADRGWFRGRGALVAVTVAAGAAFAGNRLLILPDLALGLAITAMISHSAWRCWNFASAIGAKFAEFSYTMYAIHFPIAIAMITALQLHERMPFGGLAVLVTLTSFVISGAISWIFALLTEKQTIKFRDLILTLTQSLKPAAA